ncbi:MAG: hypothetical protein LBP33_09325 [Candidatus Adiutrix sp.]|jgi:Leucine-rich repeat (LRR) protein|nr:hypothetical protein [Candidatus Adiutrix sp.]
MTGRRPYLFPALALLGLLTALPLSAQKADQAYESRAQEVLAALSRINGLDGLNPDTPGAWPELTDPGALTAPGRSARGAAWQRGQNPASLESLVLVGQGLARVADFSGLRSLVRLELTDNALRGLNLAGDSALVILAAGRNQLKNLDLGSCPNLELLALSDNQLEKLEPASAPRLKALQAAMNRLTALDLRGNPELVRLDLANNQLTGLDLSGNPALSLLSLSYNRLKYLNLSANPLLTDLGLRDNELKRLDLGANPFLSELNVSRNQLTELDLGRAAALRRLAAGQNLIAGLDLSANPRLESLDLQANPLTEIRTGQNELAELSTLNLDGCRLPLSKLAFWSGRARLRGRLGNQEKVLFEYKCLAPDEPLDLSGEMSIDGQPTAFQVLTEKRRRVKPDDYEIAEGLIRFKKPGRYLVEMTNGRVLSSESKRAGGQLRAYKARAVTGLVEVASQPLSDKNH